MLIGLFGGICAGKHEVADYLVAHHGFTLRKMPGSVCSGSGVDPKSHTAEQDEFIDYITKYSQKRWVTIIDGCYEYALQALLRRPFFLFVYIDASLSTRWKRYKDRCVFKGHFLTAGRRYVADASAAVDVL
ncbi:hypothetical protein GP486_004328 [Trichoglossum hirsutum]|uniref:Uncharacterized protein n=1 Tax=Trichoglossum hirsutum TaxID=265104 RepID=A0A9P8LBD6_9PEZI|nr:hypothetical protein GP486_004328 [Trichoglossum hirsutum]